PLALPSFAPPAPSTHLNSSLFAIFSLNSPTSTAFHTLSLHDALPICPTVIGVAANPLRPSAVAVKFRLAGAWKSSDGGLKTYPDRLGVTRYTVPVEKSVWVQKPDASLVTGAGMGPPPATLESVMVTPGRPTTAPLFTVPATAYGVLGSPRVTV